MTQLTPQMLTAVRDLSHKASEYLQQHPDGAFDTTAVIRRLRTALAQALSDSRPKSACLAQLPPALMDRILHMLDLHSRWAVSCSCRSLRRASQHAVEIRAIEPFHESKPAMWTDVLSLLAQTDNTPVYATYSHDFAVPPEQAEQLYAQSFSRAHGLILKPYGATVWNRCDPCTFDLNDLLFYEPIHFVSRPGEREWIAFSRLLRFPALQLRTFQLRVNVPVFEGFPPVTIIVPPNIFAQQSGALRSCLLQGVTLPSDGCPAFSSLTLLDYSPSGGVISPAETAEVLRCLPSLVMLGLTLESFRGPSYRKVASHRSLKRVVVRYSRSCQDTSSNRRAILFFLRFALDEFVLDLREEAYSVRSMYRLIPGLPWNIEKLPGISSVAKYLPPTTDIAALNHCAVVTGRSYRLVIPMHAFRLYDDTALFAHLQSLTISAEYWTAGPHRLPPAPAVISLCVAILPHHCGTWAWEMWRSVPEDPAQGPWDCPALETLEIAYVAPLKHRTPEGPVCGCHRPGTIALEDVACFVRNGLRFQAQRLRRITLSGISDVVDPEPGTAFVALHELTRDLEIQPATSAHIQRLRTFLHKERMNSHSATSLLDPTFAEDQKSDSESRSHHMPMGLRELAGFLSHW